jgi:hypothetical protein
MASRHSTSRRRSYGRRVHEIRERAHEGRRFGRDELRSVSVDDAPGAQTDGNWDRTREDGD